MGAMSPMVGISARAAESLEKVRSSLGDKVQVDLFVNADEKKHETGNVLIQFESVEQAKKMSEKALTALRDAGFEVKGDVPIMTRSLD